MEKQQKICSLTKEVQYFVFILFVMYLKWVSFITPAKFGHIQDTKVKKTEHPSHFSPRTQLRKSGTKRILREIFFPKFGD
jgi:hypothetical protein